MEINILLGKIPPKQLGAPVDYYKAVHGAYTSQYLEALGIEPLDRHRKVVALRAPLQKCTIEATWESHGSGVCDQLRILPPQTGRGSHEGLGSGLRGPLWSEVQQDPMIWALPPDTSGIYEKTKKPRSTKQKGYGVEERYLQAFSEMRLQDQKNSKGADSALTKELEDFQSHAKGEERIIHKREVLRQWGKEGFRELDGLKSKFILPFACETRHGISVWSQLQTLAVPQDFVADLQRPVSITLERIREEATDYAENFFPLELLSTRRDPLFFDGIRQCLQSEELSRLIGLASHLVYWNALVPA